MAKWTVANIEKWHVAMRIKDVQGHVLNVHIHKLMHIGEMLYSCQVVHFSALVINIR